MRTKLSKGFFITIPGIMEYHDPRIFHTVRELLKSSENSLQEQENLVPLHRLQIALRYWWVILLGLCLGGFIGAGVNHFRPPIYQAQAVISTGIDFARTGKLTDVEEDYMIKKVGDLIKSDAVIEETLKRASAQGMELDRQAFDQMHFLQRSFNDWLLIVRSQDPRQAARLSNLWAEAAWSALEEASDHLIRLDAYRSYLNSQITCRDLQFTTNLGTICYLESPEDIGKQIDQTQALIKNEQLAARGLVNGVVFNLTALASVPNEPQIRGRGTMALAGALIGGLLACLSFFGRKSNQPQAMLDPKKI